MAGGRSPVLRRVFTKAVIDALDFGCWGPVWASVVPSPPAVHRPACPAWVEQTGREGPTCGGWAESDASAEIGFNDPVILLYRYTVIPLYRTAALLLQLPSGRSKMCFIYGRLDCAKVIFSILQKFSTRRSLSVLGILENVRKDYNIGRYT